MIVKTNWKRIKIDLAQNSGSYLAVYPFGQLEILLEPDDVTAEEAVIIPIDDNIDDVYGQAKAAKKQFEIENEAIITTMSRMGKRSAEKRDTSSKRMSEVSRSRWGRGR